MRISFSPQRRDDALEVTRRGDVLTINGEVFDFSDIPDGETSSFNHASSSWIVGPVERIEGELHLTLLLPHGAQPSEAVAFPSALVDPADGNLPIPNSRSK